MFTNEPDLSGGTLSDFLLNLCVPPRHQAETSGPLCCSMCFLTFPGTEAIACLKGIQRRHRDQGPYDREFDAPPYTTIQHGLIHGGIAVNTVAGRCEFDFDIRFLPGVDPMGIVKEAQDFVERHVLPEMHAVSNDTGFTWDIVPGCEDLNTPAEDEVVRLALDLAQTDRTYKVGFGTEAGHFQKAGIPTVVCGPGNIDQAHKADEFIALDQVAQCEAFMRRLMTRVCNR